MILELVKEDAPILKQACEDFDFSNPPCDPIELAKNLNETMIAKDGLGLSANQVGLPYRVFVIRIEKDEPFPIFNPKILTMSDKMISMKEGCLSFPLLYMSIKRPDSVRIRFTDQYGETSTHRFIFSSM